MATYKEIQGQSVVNASSDVSSEGQVFYNVPGNAFKLSSLTTAAWATSGNIPGGGGTTMGGFGTQTAAVSAGGEPGASPPKPPQSNAVYEYNGSTWTSGNAIPVAKREMAGGAGTESAGLICGGFSYPPFSIKTGTEEYDGTNWTSGGALSTALQGKGCLGTQTAALAFGGASPTVPPSTITEEYNGSSWTAGGAMSDGTATISGCGTQTAGLIAGGNTEEYNGSSWTAGGALTTPRGTTRGATQATQTAGMIIGGATTPNNTELYDGTSFSVTANLNTARAVGNGAGEATAGLYFAGDNDKDGTEEFTGAGLAQTETIDVT